MIETWTDVFALAIIVGLAGGFIVWILHMLFSEPSASEMFGYGF